MLQKLLILAAGGALGTLARVGTIVLSARMFGTVFPWGTFVVNAAGCFLFGLVFAISEHRFALSANMKLLLLTGFMGAFTTFSTYAFETTQLMRGDQWMMAAGNILGQTVIGVALVLIGLKVGQWV